MTETTKLTKKERIATEQRATRLLHQHIQALEWALTRTPDITVYVPDPDAKTRPKEWGTPTTYVLRAYGLTSATGGMLVEFMRLSGPREKKPQLTVAWAGSFDEYRLKVQRARLTFTNEWIAALQTATERINAKREQLVGAMVAASER